MKKIQALWQFGRGSRTVPGVSLRKRSILCDLVIAGASLFYFGQGYAFAQDINSGLAGYWPCSDINDNMLDDYSGNGGVELVGTMHDTISDTQTGFQARPVIGGIYSILARLNSGN